MLNKVKLYFHQNTDSSSLSLFRFFFGFLMFFSIIRFVGKGWVEDFYINPNFHFSYYGFEWVTPLGDYTYLLFFICAISSLFVCVGFKYRFSIIVFFLSFTYIELMDKTYYLNHYYFVSILSFLLIFLPANSSFSIDNILSKKKYKTVPKWTVDCIKLLVSIIYIYAAIAKMNSDWLLHAQPLQTWIQTKHDFPIFGDTFFQQKWFYYFMSWAGLLYDLTIPFLLLYNKTRIFGFLLVILFHLLTVALFPIGMFPYIMIFCAIIFFSSQFHNRVINMLKLLVLRINKKIKFVNTNFKIMTLDKFEYSYRRLVISIVFLFFVVQILFPFRYLLYPGELFWHEQGYRFSWRVMLVEKIGLASFKIKDPDNGNEIREVVNSDFLTYYQEKQMSFQPDMILQYAHYLGDFYKNKDVDFDGIIDFGENIQVFVDCKVKLNGFRETQRLIDPNINLYTQKESFKNKTWILPLNDEIKGF